MVVSKRLTQQPKLRVMVVRIKGEVVKMGKSNQILDTFRRLIFRYDQDLMMGGI